MALTPSGTISMSDVNSALGQSSTASISFNDDSVRFLANQDSGSVTMNNMRNKYYYTGTILSKTWYDKGETLYGYDIYGAPTGSVTGQILNYSGFDFFYTNASTATTLIGGIGFSYTNVGNARLQVGSGTKVPMYWNGNSYWTGSGGGQAIVAGDVNVTRTWRWATT